MNESSVTLCSNIISEHCTDIKKILVIEDSISLQEHIVNSLSEVLELECDVAATEAESIRLLEENSYDLVIVDIYLPDSSGNFIGALLRKRHKVFIITAVEDELQRSKLVSLPIVDYLYKTDEKTIIKYLINAIKRLQENEKTVIAICDDSRLVRLKMIDILVQQNFAYVEFENGQVAYECILNSGMKIDLLITDVDMPKMNGPDLVRFVRHEYDKNELPILALSASQKDSIVSEMLKLGANDYIGKPFSNEEFMTRLNSALDQARLYRHNQDLIRRLEEMSTVDFLSNLYNRHYFYSIITHIQAQAKRDGHTFGIIMIDVDHFKYVNDTYGHDAGDVALKHVSAIIQKSARESDVACRWGGEEFLILVPKCTLTSLVEYAERLRQLIEKSPVVIDKGILEFSLTASLGVATGRDDSVEATIALADKRLYMVKESGRNAVGFK